MAATVPTRWPVPRPDAGRPSAAVGGSGGVAIGCSCRVDLLCRPAELTAVAQHAMEDDDLLDKVAKSAVGFVHTIARNALRRRPMAGRMVNLSSRSGRARPAKDGVHDGQVMPGTPTPQS